jgi:hypothetical protein
MRIYICQIQHKYKSEIGGTHCDVTEVLKLQTSLFQNCRVEFAFQVS